MTFYDFWIGYLHRLGGVPLNKADIAWMRKAAEEAWNTAIITTAYPRPASPPVAGTGK